jgi:hypothetical protein
MLWLARLCEQIVGKKALGGSLGMSQVALGVTDTAHAIAGISLQHVFASK